MITVSVVSHRQNALVNLLLADLERSCTAHIALLVTENTPDPERLETESRSYPTTLICNTERKGFGANHNAAFRLCGSPFFCVVNPDIRLQADPFPALCETLSLRAAGVAAPLVRNVAGSVEDSARRFPTAMTLAKKVFTRAAGPDYAIDAGVIEVDWIAGMFMLFRSEAYARIGGFDERYFLYYEDVDICRRLRNSGYAVYFDPRAAIVHDARRGSRRSPWLAMHHLASALRYLARP